MHQIEDKAMDMRDYILQRCEELKRQRLKPALHHPSIYGLLQLLPPIGAPFPKRKEWIEAMDATTALLYNESHIIRQK